MLMTTTSLSLYDILVDKGVDRETAKAALNDYITRKEAELSLATKGDLEKSTRWVIGVFVAIAFGQMAATTAIIALMFNFYLQVGA